MRHWGFLAIFLMALSVHAGSATTHFDAKSDSMAEGDAKWSKKTLAVRLDFSGNSADRSVMLRAIEKAIQLWNSVDAGAPRLRTADARRGSKPFAEISIRAARSEEDLRLFSGVDSEAAAFTRLFANSNGEVRRAVIIINPFTVFDSKDSSDSVSLEWVMAHELGHALGMTHSASLSSLMFPRAGKMTASANVSDLLSEDDRTNLRGLYGGDEESCCLTIKGTVTAPFGEDLGDYTVAVESLSDSRLLAVRQLSSDGSFRIGGLDHREIGIRVLNRHSIVVGVMDTALEQSYAGLSRVLELEPVSIVPRDIESHPLLGKDEWLSTTSIDFNGSNTLEFNLGFRKRGDFKGAVFGHFGGVFADFQSELAMLSQDWIVWKVTMNMDDRQIPDGEYSFYIDGNGYSIMIPGALRLRK